jgi:benzoyl-CoA reductase/2-hydroxyglutaryl-CoA dehydratase subunit BcrC/BadD/HgdB
MRRLSEAIELSESRPVFLLNVPHTWKTLNARKLYASEVQRLGRFLNELGGESPSDHKLASSMSDFDKMRSELRALRGRLKPRQFSEIIADFGIDTRIDFQSQTGTYVPRGIPLGLIGGPLLREHFRIFDLLEDCGGYVALDGTETGERAFPAPFDRRRVCEDPFPTLIDSYFDSIPDPARTPNTRLYEWLRSAIDRRNLRGIILARHLGCDNWHAEVGRMRESLRIPFFDLDITGSFADTPGKHTRLQAFMEMIR